MEVVLFEGMVQMMRRDRVLGEHRALRLEIADMKREVAVEDVLNRLLMNRVTVSYDSCRDHLDTIIRGEIELIR